MRTHFWLCLEIQGRRKWRGQGVSRCAQAEAACPGTSVLPPPRWRGRTAACCQGTHTSDRTLDRPSCSWAASVLWWVSRLQMLSPRLRWGAMSWSGDKQHGEALWRAGLVLPGALLLPKMGCHSIEWITYRVSAQRMLAWKIKRYSLPSNLEPPLPVALVPALQPICCVALGNFWTSQCLIFLIWKESWPCNLNGFTSKILTIKKRYYLVTYFHCETHTVKNLSGRL